jgi:hypothetical protein
MAPGFIIWRLAPAPSSDLLVILRDIAWPIGFWFLLGAFLGKYIDKLGRAALIWLAVLIIGGIFVAISLIFFPLTH